ncbi:aldo/keto reductase [Pseudomonadales bacterium]|nr:aldo/keto reductase [Pseudomonadales bacterium]
MTRSLCLGLLGFSGNYIKQDLSNLGGALFFALNSFDLIDISTDYGIDYNLVETLKKLNISNTKARFIYKVGSNYSEAYDVNQLIHRTNADMHFFGVSKIDSIMFHRPSSSKLSSDTKFFRFIRSIYPDIPFGICTNSESIYTLYNNNMDIEVVQIALNPLDYVSNSALLSTLSKNCVSIQARSILSSGLLSGKYDHESRFTHHMRSRYHLKAVSSKYRNRIETASKVIRYIGDEYNISLEDVPVFLYSIFENIPCVKRVIRGGSSLEQISKNLTTIPIDLSVLNHFITMMEADWGCEYV